jgi:sulfoxide reductase heme-binding subunit YedZ
MRRLLDAGHVLIKSRLFYPLVFIAALTPAVGLALKFYRHDLGVNPTETLLHETGKDALMLLMASLAITPIRRFTGWNRIQVVRRMLGVWSFVYALSHFLIYAFLDQIGLVDAILEDIAKRPFITIGMLAFSILLVLALTSTNGMMRRLGRNWQRLHRLVYVALGAAIIHFIWGQKSNISEPLQWAAAGTFLLGVRVWFSWRKRRSPARAAQT